MIKKELQIFLTAVMFFTRIPVTKKLEYSDEKLNKAIRYFPFVGAIVGSFGAGIFVAALKIFPFQVSVLFSMIATILITGAFHEDGFADFCDGYGGGDSKNKILSIMKDSRLGTYGTIGIISMLGVKYLSLIYLPTDSLIYIMIAGHTFSRLSPVILIMSTNYVRDDDNSKSKPVGSKVSVGSLIVTLIIGLSSLVLFDLKYALLIILVNTIVFLFFRIYIMKKTDGYTGDVLGALQQISEVLLYLTLIVLYRMV